MIITSGAKCLVCCELQTEVEEIDRLYRRAEIMLFSSQGLPTAAEPIGNNWFCTVLEILGESHQCVDATTDWFS